MEKLRERTIQYVSLAIVPSSGGLFREGRHSPIIITSITYKPIQPQTSLIIGASVFATKIARIIVPSAHRPIAC